MRLKKTEIDKRLKVSLNKNISEKKLSKESKKYAQGIMTFGENNDYPQIIERLHGGSISAKSISSIYSRFLVGLGFTNPAINTVVVGKDEKGKDVTLIQILRKVCFSISFNWGAYIHSNLNIEGKISNTKLVPFKYCRFGKKDDAGYCSKIAVNDEWDKDNGRIDENKINWYNVFNPDPKIIASQIENAGSIEEFKGQINHLFLDDEYLYPLSPIDPVYLDCDTEQQISIYQNNLTRNGFLAKSIIRYTPSRNKEEKEELEKEFEKWLGADGSQVIALEDENSIQTEGIKDPGNFKIDKIDSSIDDKLFSTWNDSLTKRIRKAYRGIPSILIDYDTSSGSLNGASGAAMVEAINYYNLMTQDDRTAISEFIKDIYSHFVDPVLQNNQDWSIKELDAYEKQPVQTDLATQKKIESQATLKGSVGGVQALLQIQQSVADGITDRSAAITIIEEIFGINSIIAEKMLGTPKL
jgi:hypothetical protein